MTQVGRRLLAADRKRLEELEAMAGDPARHTAFLMRASLLEGTRRAIRN